MHDKLKFLLFLKLYSENFLSDDHCVPRKFTSPRRRDLMDKGKTSVLPLLSQSIRFCDDICSYIYYQRE